MKNLFLLKMAEYEALTDGERAVISLFKPDIEREVRPDFIARREKDE